jgi:hypothetical protein
MDIGRLKMKIQFKSDLNYQNITIKSIVNILLNNIKTNDIQVLNNITLMKL